MGDHHNQIGMAIGPHTNEGAQFCTIVLLAGQVVSKESKDFERYQPKTDKSVEKDWDKFNTEIFQYQN